MSTHDESITETSPKRRTRADRGAAEPARYALLGLLWDAPSHGYNLARRFASSTALGDIIHLNPSHLYALLSLLERDGLISGERQTAGARPQRRVYALTDVGRNLLMRWIDEPVGHPRDMRIEFPLKLYMARRIDPRTATTLIARQRAVFEEYARTLADRGPGGHVDEEQAFMLLMRAGRIDRARAAIAWLDDWAEPLVSGVWRDVWGGNRSEEPFG